MSFSHASFGGQICKFVRRKDFFSNSAKLKHIFKINSDKTRNQMNICLVELKMKYSFKTGCFASKWLIEIEAKGTNWRGNSSLWSNHWNEAKEKSMFFRIFLCHLLFDVWPVGLYLTSWTFSYKDSAWGTCSLNRGIGLYIIIYNFIPLLLCTSILILSFALRGKFSQSTAFADNITIVYCVEKNTFCYSRLWYILNWFLNPLLISKVCKWCRRVCCLEKIRT